MTEPGVELGNQGRKWTWGLWLFIAVILLTQWPRLRELYLDSTQGEIKSPIAWRHEYDAALRESSEQGKSVLVVFSASWCPPCKVMKRQVWPNAEVAAVVQRKFVPVYVDVDLQNQRDVVQRYQIRSIPTVMIVNSQGEILRKRSGMSLPETLDFLGT